MDPATPLLADYPGLPGTWDELFTESGAPRPAFRKAYDALGAHTRAGFAMCQGLAERALLNQGVTFSVYSDQRGTEKIFPFCLVPRMVSAPDWAALERGLVQRVRALELFLDDIYGDQRILADGAVPADLVLGLEELVPAAPRRAPGGRRAHPHRRDRPRPRSRRAPGACWRTTCARPRASRTCWRTASSPSGSSPRSSTRRASSRWTPTRRGWPSRSARSRPVGPDETSAVVLTPGPYNSAYFEHSFLARTMGLELVQAADLFVERRPVFCRTTRGPRPVHVIYRRIDETYLDPEVFRPDSLLGVPGIMRAWAEGNVTLANAPGQRRRRRQGGLPVRARHHPLLPVARSRCWPSSTPASARATTTGASCSTTSTSWW